MAPPKEPFTLYHNYWSSCSLMVRLALELGKQNPNVPEVPVVLKEIDIQHGGQLEESFIADINRMGTVPALTHPTLLAEPITESVDITKLFYQKYYPTLCPKEHQAQIEKLIVELHDIIFMTLSFKRWPERGDQIVNGTANKLKDPTISARHRAALEYKLSVQKPAIAEYFTPEIIKREDDKATALFSTLAEIKKKYGNSTSPWLFGGEYGTALDADTLILLCRLLDVGGENVVHPDILAYGKVIMDGDLWQNFMRESGGTTMHIPEGSDYSSKSQH